MHSHNLCGQGLNYYSKKYISEQSEKEKKKKISPLRFQSSKSKNLVQLLNPETDKQSKLKSFEVSYAIQIKQQDQTQHQNDYNESMAGFFFDQSKQSLIQQFKSFKFQGDPPQYCDTTENTPLKLEVPAKINEDSQLQISKQVNGQQQNNPQSSTELKNVLSEPDIKIPMSPPLTALPRRMTEYTNKAKESKVGDQKKSSVKVSKLLKRFAKYEDKVKQDKSTNNLESLGKITQKIDEDDFY